MQSPGSRLLFVCAAVLLAVPAGAATPAFTVSATNVTLPGGKAEGTGQFTLTSVNGYTGRLVVNAQFAGGDMNAKPPSCRMPSILFTLNANQSVTGNLICLPYGVPVPAVKLHRLPARSQHAPVLALAVAGFLCLRRRLRASAARWLGLFVLAVVTLTSMSACGGNGLSGTYPFTVTATDTVTQAAVKTSIMVTVP
jgi:hypothetical protein